MVQEFLKVPDILNEFGLRQNRGASSKKNGQVVRPSGGTARWPGSWTIWTLDVQLGYKVILTYTKVPRPSGGTARRPGHLEVQLCDQAT